MDNSQKTEKKSVGLSLVLILVSICICFLTSFFPVFLILNIILISSLIDGKRYKFSVTVFVISTLILLMMNGLLITLLFSLIEIIVVLVNALTVYKFKKIGIFNSVLISCSAVALSVALSYGILYLIYSGDPIAAYGMALEKSLSAGTDADLNALRILYQFKQTLLLYFGNGYNMTDMVAIADKANSMNVTQLLEETAGFTEYLLRTILPTLTVYIVSVGGLFSYTLPVYFAGNGKRTNRLFQLDTNENLPILKSFCDWTLPRDIGRSMYISLLVLFILNFVNTDRFYIPFNLVYTLFLAVFYVQGLSFANYMMRKWKWSDKLRHILTFVVGLTVPPFVAILGMIEYLMHFRTFMKFKETGVIDGKNFKIININDIINPNSDTKSDVSEKNEKDNFSDNETNVDVTEKSENETDENDKNE